jgi:hypothetical protein
MAGHRCAHLAAGLELARYCVRALAHDVAMFIDFARAANFEDGGEAAAVKVYGGSLGGVIHQFFGPGDWSPAAGGGASESAAAHDP